MKSIVTSFWPNFSNILNEYSEKGYCSGIGFYLQRILCHDHKLFLQDVECADAHNSRKTYQIVTRSAGKERRFASAFWNFCLRYVRSVGYWNRFVFCAEVRFCVCVLKNEFYRRRFYCRLGCMIYYTTPVLNRKIYFPNFLNAVKNTQQIPKGIEIMVNYNSRQFSLLRFLAFWSCCLIDFRVSIMRDFVTVNTTKQVNAASDSVKVKH